MAKRTRKPSLIDVAACPVKFVDRSERVAIPSESESPVEQIRVEVEPTPAAILRFTTASVRDHLAKAQARLDEAKTNPARQDLTVELITIMVESLTRSLAVHEAALVIATGDG